MIDGGYWAKLGDLVLRNADVVVWLDLPVRVWLPRLDPPDDPARCAPGGALEQQS